MSLNPFTILQQQNKKHVRGYLYANAKQQSKYFSRQRTNHALFLMRMFSVHGFLVRAHLISIMQILKTYTHRKQLFHFIYQRNPTLTPRNNNPFWHKLEYITPINHYKFTKAFARIESELNALKAPCIFPREFKFMFS